MDSQTTAFIHSKELPATFINPVELLTKASYWHPKLLDPAKLALATVFIHRSPGDQFFKLEEFFLSLFPKDKAHRQVRMLPAHQSPAATYNLVRMQLSFNHPDYPVVNVGFDPFNETSGHDHKTWEPTEWVNQYPVDFALTLKDSKLYRNRFNHRVYYIHTENVVQAAELILQLLCYDLNNCTIVPNPKGEHRGVD